MRPRGIARQSLKAGAGEIELARNPGNHWALDECGHVDKRMPLC